ncbi:hypothetical protein BGE01nite_23800 [Brevifollis gellanilyticus]|uniref:Uncharacterized protein n=2 Tax=Brevifollis gellanilyticus TaxID=748831 RepID=A0A512M8M3_9BACT|nr:hypothetical protein BGE01nite_23800 [Brevifollis gellanilyticus]
MLYDLAAYESFMLDYSPRLRQPGYNVMESIPGNVITALEYSYARLGYKKLRLLNKTDVKWLVEAWGEPQKHTTLNALHKAVWDRFEATLLGRAAKESDLSNLHYSSIISIMESPPLPSYYPPPLPTSIKPKSSAAKAGWICIVIGVLTFWTLIGMVFFSVAMVLGVVAMCNNRVGEGLAILVSAIGSLALCGVLLMTLVFGTVLGGMADAMAKSPKTQVQRLQHR